jgi:hypothetical protein
VGIVIDGKTGGRIEVRVRRERRYKQVVDDLKQKTRYWKLKKKASDRAVWRNGLEEAMDQS